MMISSSRVSQQDIANKAGVHITTVSLALRDSPRLPISTRKRIQDLAREMGYHPDPMLSALTVYRERLKRVRHQGTLAWMSKASPASSFPHYRKGAEERCAELGYQLEDFQLGQLGRTRLSKILRTRNIQGLLIPPLLNNRAHINFDWENFSAVCFGFTLARPRLHLVTNAQYRSARIAVRALRVHGFRRLAFVTTHNVDERTDQNFSSGFLSEQRRFKPADYVPILILKDSTLAGECQEFKRWYTKHKPEVIIFHYNAIFDFMQRLGIKPAECGAASLSLAGTDGTMAGVYQNDRLIGRAAVDFLIGMIHRNERGIPPTRSQLLIDGTWIDGDTIRPKRVKTV